tara:strand:+ start:4078 stop:4737 length:660 start_codon:yes stop_codon:yes gene_type:complete
MVKLKVLELFAGSRSFSKVAEEFGHETYTSDLQPFDDIDQVCDIFDFDIDKMIKYFGKPEIVWCSPPCQAFSVASISTHWTGGHRAYIPKTEKAKTSIKILNKMMSIINIINPKYWYIENPRGVMRKVSPMVELKEYRNTIWYCQYFGKGDSIKRAKPTDIWTNDKNWTPRPVCKNGNPLCDHERAPRGSRTGTQGLKNNYERSKVPAELCKEIIKGIK